MFKIAAALLLLALAQADDWPIPPMMDQNVVDLASTTPELSFLTEAVTFVGLATVLANLTEITVFAPTDDAFAAVDPKYFEEQWGYHLADILLYHVTEGRIMSSDLEQDLMVPMFNYEYANITSLDPPMINNATIIGADVPASNGAVHVIDQVLLPSSATTNIVEAASSEKDFSTLVSLIVAADLGEALSSEGPFTVFAPVNPAFAALDEETVAFLTSPEGKSNLTEILTYHVAEGILHSHSAPPGTSSIEMLSGDELFVTTPTLDELFGNFTEGLFENFTEGFLGDFLTGGDAGSPEMMKKQAHDHHKGNMTDDDGDFEDMEYDWHITLNGGAAKVVWPDILVSNGIIHIIDGVLLPSQTEGLEVDTFADQVGDLIGDVVGDILDTVTSKQNPDMDGI